MFAVTIISPIRLHYTGNYDQGEDNEALMMLTQNALRLLTRQIPEGLKKDGDDDGSDDGYKLYLWVYVVFTYFFTFLTAYFMMRQTIKVLRVRQKYLGQQNSITDRTIRLSGIPPELRTETALKDYIESLGIGGVRSLHLCRHWATLDSMFEKRKELIRKLEKAWCEYLGPNWSPKDNENGLNRNSIYPFVETDGHGSSRSIPLQTEGINSHSSLTNPTDTNGDTNGDINDDIADADDREDTPFLSSGNENVLDITTSSAPLQLGTTTKSFKRPKERLGLFGWFGEEIDVIDYYSNELEVLDSQIETSRKRHYPATDTAFVTMDSVASAQMAAQAVLDPRPNRLLARPAPAPHDIIWKNLYMPRHERIIRTYTITIVIAILTVALIFPVSYLASFLELKTIKRLRPSLGKLIERSVWMTTFVTGILPPLIFTLFNFAVPYLYWYLANFQGFVSYGEVELSVISKNFFYVFFNLFLVFTVAGNYWTFLKDTTQLAYKLAESLMKFSLFYIDLIILQGIAMFPFKLLQIGSIMQMPFKLMSCNSPRNYCNRYRPPVFNYGINLPQPILIFIIVILYSVISTKILFFGTIYFMFGYMTYKYQLMYTMIHPQHSTGQSWVLIMRRVCLGIVIFHLTMAGILALQKAYFLATLLGPLPIATFFFWYNFEESYVPLSFFIALTAIETVGSGDGGVTSSTVSFMDTDEDHAMENGAIQHVHKPNSQEQRGSISVSSESEQTGSSTDDANSKPAFGGHQNNNNGNYSSELIVARQRQHNTEEASLEPSHNVLIHNSNRQNHRKNHNVPFLRSAAQRFVNAGIPNFRVRAFSVAKTLDEERERNQRYVNPHLIKPLDGPWIGFEGTNEVIIANNEGTVKKRVRLEDWE